MEARATIQEAPIQARRYGNIFWVELIRAQGLNFLDPEKQVAKLTFYNLLMYLVDISVKGLLAFMIIF